jgi:hypothetical protein
MLIDTNDFITYPILDILEHHFYTDSFLTILTTKSYDSNCLLFYD